MPFIGAAIGAVVGAIGTAAAAIGSFVTGLGFLGQALIGIGLNVAVGLIQKANQKKPIGGVQFDRQYGADVPRQVAVGLVGIAGHDCYVNTFGKSNKLLQQVYVVSDYYCDGMSRVSINGEWATLGNSPDPSKGYPVTSGDFANLIWVKFFDGTQEAADGYLIDKAHPATRWTEDHIGLGLAFFLISMTYDKEKNNQFPDFFFEFRGARLYDWRKDSTVGGSGSHRWGDYATHEYTTNPILADYSYRRGLSVNGDLFCGMEMNAADLPLDKYTAAAAICDETVEGEHRYQLSMLIDCTATHGENVESIMLSCGGMVIDGVDGSWPLVGSDQPSVATITDDDFIVGAPFQFRAKRSMAEIVNSVSGNSPDPAQLWSMVGYEPQISETALVVDRRTRDVSIDFPQVPSLRQAAQLASIYLEENRWEATASGMLRPRWQVLEPGDWITWASVKYGTRTMMISEASLASLDSDGPRNAQISMQERDGSIYDGIPNPVVNVPPKPGAPDYLSELENFQALAVVVSGDEDRKRPAIRVSWNAITDETVDQVEIRYWPAADPVSVITKIVPADGTAVVLTDGVVSATDYEVDSKLITEPLRTTVRSSPISVTTDDIRQTDVTAYLDGVGQDVYATLQQLRADHDDLRARMELIAAATADATGKDIELHTVAKRFQNATAVAMREMKAAISDDDGNIVAVASILDAVQVAVGNVSADGLRKIEVTAGAGDVVARLTDMVRATIDDDWVEAGTVTEVGFTGGDPEKPFSRMLFIAGQFVFTDGTNDFLPVVIEGGEIKLAIANIGTVTAGVIKSPDDKFVITLSSGKLEWFD